MNEQAVFINEYEITVPLLRKMNAPSPKKHPPTFRLYVTVMFILAVYFMLGVARTAIFGDISNMAFYGGMSAAFAILIIVQNAAVPKRIYKMNMAYFGESKWIRNIAFTESGFTVRDGNTVATLDFNQVRFISNLDDAYLLWLEVGYFYIFKNAFTKGSAEEFLAFIKDKCTALWTRKSFYKNASSAKSAVNTIITVFFAIATVVMIFTTVRGLKRTDPEYAAVFEWGDGLQVITTETVSDGVAVFGVDDYGDIVVMLLEKTGMIYKYEEGYYYDVSDLLEFDEPDWFNDIEFGVSFSAKPGYTCVPFNYYGEEELYLYYAID